MDSVAEREALRNALMDLLGIAKQLRHEGVPTGRIPDLFLATTVATLQSTAWEGSPLEYLTQSLADYDSDDANALENLRSSPII